MRSAEHELEPAECAQNRVLHMLGAKKYRGRDVQPPLKALERVFPLRHLRKTQTKTGGGQIDFDRRHTARPVASPGERDLQPK